jgi:Concanavalin A-like lectin/glucanases superfamily
MAYNTSGTNQSLGNDGGLTGVDVDAFTFSFNMIVNARVATVDTPFNTTAAHAAGGSRCAINVIAPGVSGFRFRVFYNFSTTAGNWQTDDLALGTLYRCVVTYDRSSTANHPRMWLNGAEVTITRTLTPAGTAVTGVDGIRAGENAAGGQDANAQISEIGLWSRVVNDDEAVALSKAYAPSIVQRGLEHYWPLIRTLDDRVKGATATLTGAPTVVAHPGMIYPIAEQSIRVAPPAAPPTGHAGGLVNSPRLRSKVGGALAR